MAEQEGTDSVAETATTPGSVETVAPTTETPDTASDGGKVDPFDRADPWANIDKVTIEPAAEAEKTDTGKEPDADKKADEEPEKAEEKPLEDQVLEELFTPDADKKAEDKDDDLDAQDPEKMIAGQRNATARAWAERVSKRAELVKEFQYPDKDSSEFKPIADIAQKLESLNPERFAELSQHTAHKLVDANPDATFQRAYALKLLQADPKLDLATVKIPTLDEVISGASTSTDAVVVPELAELTAGLDKEIDWEWRDEKLDGNFVDERERAFAKTLRGMEAKIKAETVASEALKSERDELKQAVEAQAKPVTESEEQKNVRAKLHETIGNYQKSVKEKLLPYIAKVTGLEVSKDDTPEITEWKQRKMLDYTGTEYEIANNIDPKFESFAYNESSVKSELNTVVTRLVDLQLKESQALVAANNFANTVKDREEAKAKADEYHRAAEDERVPLFTLLHQANKEFKAKFIDPDLALIGKLSSKLADPIKDASERVEVVSNGGGVPASPAKRPEYSTADDVWNSLPVEAAKEETLRANA